MLKKIFNKIFQMIKEYFINLKYFGFKIANLNFLCEFSMIPFLQNRMESLHQKRYKYINHYLVTNFDYLIDKYRRKTMVTQKGKKIIWCFWYQGLDSAPLLVQKCIESIKKNAGEYQVILLTKENYQSYIKIPQFILDKLENKTITLTHFSDILRAGLLKEHGGIWVDATMYFTKNIFKEFDNKIFNSTILDEESNLHCTGFFMGGCPNNLFDFLYEFFLEYHKKNKYLINYFLIDYILNIAYDNLENCRKIMDLETIENKNMYLLTSKFSLEYNKLEYKNIINSAPYFKLNYKHHYNKNINGKITNYGYFMK